MSALRVVIFEADLAFAEELRQVFSGNGFQVILHHDGGDAAEFAEDAAPDLIILAIELPNRSGFAICNQIKKHPTLGAVPLVLISSHTPQESFEQHSKLRGRADRYAHKPIAADALFGLAMDAMDAARAASPESGVIEVSEDSIVEAIPGRVLRPGDSDVSGITDAAFDHIMIGDVSGEALADDPVVLAEGLPPVPDDFEDFTTVSSSSSLGLTAELLARATSPRPPSMYAPPPPPPPRSAAPPPVPKGVATSVRPAPTREPSAELEALREQVADLRSGLEDAQRLAREAVTQQARSERERADLEGALHDARREADELRARAARPAEPRAGASTREFLELREGLNRKDKEILNLRDELNKRDREILDMRDKILQQDLARADLDERLEERLRELDALRDRVAAQESAAERRDAAAREADATMAALRVDAEEAQRAHERAIAAQRESSEAAMTAERSRAESALREALDAARDAREAAESSLRAEHAEALRQREEALAAEREEALREAAEARETAAREAAEAHEAAAREARDAHEEALRARDIERDEALAAAGAQYAALSSELDEARADAAALRRVLDDERSAAAAALDDARARAAALEERAARRDAITERARRATEIAAALLDELEEGDASGAGDEAEADARG